MFVVVCPHLDLFHETAGACQPLFSQKVLFIKSLELALRESFRLFLGLGSSLGCSLFHLVQVALDLVELFPLSEELFSHLLDTEVAHELALVLLSQAAAERCGLQRLVTAYFSSSCCLKYMFSKACSRRLNVSLSVLSVTCILVSCGELWFLTWKQHRQVGWRLCHLHST